MDQQIKRRLPDIGNKVRLLDNAYHHAYGDDPLNPFAPGTLVTVAEVYPSDRQLPIAVTHAHSEVGGNYMLLGSEFELVA
jgi:hypothetical protein